MDDLISRKDAIDALSYLQTYLFDTRDPDQKISLEDARYAIEQLPSVQPEVIHCKDCKYLKHDTIFNQAWCSHPNPKGTLMVFDDSSEYCSRAERKTDG